MLNARQEVSYSSRASLFFDARQKGGNVQLHSRRPTIADVARLAKVSTATVSYVVNGTRTMSSETEQKVRLAIETLNYEPNPHARELAFWRRWDLQGLRLTDADFEGIERSSGE